MQVKDGVATFSIRSNDHLGSLPLTIRNVTGETGTVATKTVMVVEAPTVSDDDGTDDDTTVDQGPDAPDQLIGQDYKGALGEGDQGGFVLLTFDASDDHSTLDGYRIWRDIMVDTEIDTAGNLVVLSEPKLASVAWGRVDAIPGENPMRVVIAALDGDATFYGVSSERRGQSSGTTRTGGGDDGMEDDGMSDDGMEDDGMSDDGMEDDGMEDDGMEDDGEEDGMEDDGE